MSDHWRYRVDHIDNVRVCCSKRKLKDILYKPIMQCINCGTIHPRQIDSRICYLCTKVIQTDTSDFDEFERLLHAGELQIRTFVCSYDVVLPEMDNKTNRMRYVLDKDSYNYFVCGDCIRKEKDEEGVW